MDCACIVHAPCMARRGCGAAGQDRTGTPEGSGFSYHFGFRRRPKKGRSWSGLSLGLAFKALGPARLVSTFPPGDGATASGDQTSYAWTVHALCMGRAWPAEGVVRAARIELALPKEADFRTTSASAAARKEGAFVVWTIPWPLLFKALGPARLVSTPSLHRRAWLGIATGTTREVSPNLSGYTAQVSPRALTSDLQVRCVYRFRHARTPRTPTPIRAPAKALTPAP